MFNLVYQSVVVECSTGVEDLAKAIEKKSEEMLNKGYKLVTMSTVGTDKAILVFKFQDTDRIYQNLISIHIKQLVLGLTAF